MRVYMCMCVCVRVRKESFVVPEGVLIHQHAIVIQPDVRTLGLFCGTRMRMLIVWLLAC